MSEKAKLRFNICSESQRFSWVIVRDVLVTFTLSGQISVERWAEMLKETEGHTLRFGLGGAMGRSSMDSIQRKQASTLFGEMVRTAVVLDDPLTRGVVTALGWLGMRLKSFPWGDLEEAIQYLDVPDMESAELISALEHLRDETLKATKTIV